MIFVGVDWADAHHDVCLMDEQGEVGERARIGDTIRGVEQLHAMLAPYGNEPHDIVVGIETAHGLVPQALIAAGYAVYVINPFAASRYRDRHTVSRAKSDAGDAKMLADLVRTDRHNHRRYVGDTDLAEAVKVLARSHKELIWTRLRQANQLRSTLKAYFPAMLAAFPDLTSPEAVALLGRAPTPERAEALTRAQIRSILRQAGRQRRLDERTEEIHRALRERRLEAQALLSKAYGTTAQAMAAIIAEITRQIEAVQEELTHRFQEHPHAEIIRSLPGVGIVLGARMLAEFGDEPSRFVDGKARKSYAGTAPITRASGTKQVVLSRTARNSRIIDACDRWAFSSLSWSPGARAFYDAKRAHGKGHGQALRALANRWVGVLHGCLRHRLLYSEAVAWPDVRSDIVLEAPALAVESV